MANDLWKETLRHLDEGNFTALEAMLGGPKGFNKQITDWHKTGKFADQPEALAEAFTCACMLGRVSTAEYLLDSNVDPLAGTKTGLNGFHYAALSGNLAVIKLLIERGVSM
ncbi:MAG: ankyrin repeat domain-containing protein [Acidobacteria bacterium]|nr:ankyrin repeat domain-containing protein [Acidobacteriota bacterium]